MPRYATLGGRTRRDLHLAGCSRPSRGVVAGQCAHQPLGGGKGPVVFGITCLFVEQVFAGPSFKAVHVSVNAVLGQ